MGEQRIAIRRDYKKGGATMQNRAAYVITSEKAKDLANENKIAKDIIKGAKKAEKEALDRVKDSHNALIKAMSDLETSVSLYSKTVPDAVLAEQRKFKTMATKMKMLIERNMIEELRDDRCGACGEQLLDRTDRWQFCPVCGQRFRDTWEEAAQ